MKSMLQVPAAPLAVAAPPAVEWIPGGILVPSSPRPLGPQGSTRGHRITVVVVFSSIVHRIVTRIVRRNSHNNNNSSNNSSNNNSSSSSSNSSSNSSSSSSNNSNRINDTSRISRTRAEASVRATVSPRRRPLRARRRASVTWIR